MNHQHAADTRYLTKGQFSLFIKIKAINADHIISDLFKVHTAKFGFLQIFSDLDLRILKPTVIEDSNVL